MPERPTTTSIGVRCHSPDEAPWTLTGGVWTPVTSSGVTEVGLRIHTRNGRKQNISMSHEEIGDLAQKHS